MTELDILLIKVHCMVIRINLDCNACCRKMRRILLRMKEIETHHIEKQQNIVSVCGRFIPADIAIKIRKKMKRRVEILEIQELGNANGHVEEMPPVIAQPAQLLSYGTFGSYYCQENYGY